MHESIKLHTDIPYSGKLSREITFANFKVLGLSVKVFSVKINGHTHTLVVVSNDPRKFSLRISYFHQFAKVFFLESFPLYGTSKVPSHVVSSSFCNVQGEFLYSGTTHPYKVELTP